MPEQTIVIKLRDERSLTVEEQILTADSQTFRYLIDELKYEELLIDDFSPNVVLLFLTLLERKRLDDIANSDFRELHKLSVVFEVDWLRDGCRKWLRMKMYIVPENALTEKSFLFEECSYIVKKWEQKSMMDELTSCLISQNNRWLINKYMADVAKLDIFQIDVMLKIGGSNAELFLKSLLNNLDGKTELEDNVKYFLQNMNMLLCSEKNIKELYLKVIGTISNLPEISMADLRFTLHMTSQIARMVDSRIEKRKAETSEMFRARADSDTKKYKDLLVSCNTINDIPAAIVEKNVTSMFTVIDQLLYAFLPNAPSTDDTKTWLTAVENICKDRKLQKVSRQHLDAIIAALNYSYLEQADQLTALLNEISSSDNLATHHETVLIDCVVSVAVDKVSRHVYHFQHPAIQTCTEAGKCGFMLETKHEEGDRDRLDEVRLCRDSKDYKDTGIHFHDVVTSADMHLYCVRSGTVRYSPVRPANDAYDQKITLPGRYSWEKKWLSFVRDWKMVKNCVAYDISDYLVARRD